MSCVLFGQRFPGKASKLRKLYSEPHRHAGHGAGGEMGLYACTFPIITSLLSQMSGIVQPIEVILDANIKKEIEDNRKKLAPIVDTVIVCGRLGLPLRGHRDDAKYHPEVGNYSTEMTTSRAFFEGARGNYDLRISNLPNLNYQNKYQFIIRYILD